ncbi:hypothetical protein LMG1866_02800 [Achromobacter ruhlandii]|uniref:head decoration protein n=1 Tax=Achromobacter ruhlandii TaxID=72557 RepID=UPI0014662DC7|nr:head decoration protein [Achromobacter ruhlandii]CAB3705620.1 hypothetical protein LMG1866_02800 [Achromobacter ruhlandii]
MTLPVNPVGNSPQQPGIRADVFVPDQLIAGGLQIVSQPIILAAGNLPRGAVLGMITSSTAVATAAGTNTGNGTIGAVVVGAGAKLGNYQLTATAATTFKVVDPEGTTLANAAVGTAYTQGGLGFTITAGATAFAAGDTFVIDVNDAVGQFVLSVKGATDGSQVPSAILADYSDATAGPVNAGAYVQVEVNGRALHYDPSWTLPALTAALRQYAIHIKSSVSAADPT